MAQFSGSIQLPKHGHPLPFELNLVVQFGHKLLLQGAHRSLSVTVLYLPVLMDALGIRNLHGGSETEP